MSNHLKNAASPYLLQHADNPVDWYPWCDEAFEEAKRRDCPVFLSIGYSTCHWCHVMARETFEDTSIAEQLNRSFVAIKVDREERPDIDSVYMDVCQALTGQGGWPLSVFTTPDRRPFFAGTYFPPHSRFHTVGFSELLQVIADSWENDRTGVLSSARSITESLRSRSVNEAETTFGNPAEDFPVLIQNALDRFSSGFDPINGGFGPAPKFPAAHNLLFLLYASVCFSDDTALRMADKTLRQLRKGGIFDQIGFGFSRYSTDPYFLAPHFEKMLYDNALLIMAYTAAYVRTQDSVFLQVAEETARYILREMLSEEGGFCCAQDADSDGEEGKYYLFSREEILSLLGPGKGDRFLHDYDITARGHLNGKSIPNQLKNGSLITMPESDREMLYAYRKKRCRLRRDDKILTSWNALTVSALLMLFRVSKKEKYKEAALRAAAFIQENLYENGILYAGWLHGRRSGDGFLDDYAFYAAALLELYASTLDERYLKEAEAICREAIQRFEDTDRGGFFFCEKEKSPLLWNPKKWIDGAMPCGNAVMAYVLIRLYQLTDNEEWGTVMEKQLHAMLRAVQPYPEECCMSLLAWLLYSNPPAQVVIAVPDEGEKERLRFFPFLANVKMTVANNDYPLLNGKTTYYVCRNHMCLPPQNEMPTVFIEAIGVARDVDHDNRDTNVKTDLRFHSRGRISNPS